ncbi:putative ribonuclease H-like domain-containing protein [Tanacetum coccineum]
MTSIDCSSGKWSKNKVLFAFLFILSFCFCSSVFRRNGPSVPHISDAIEVHQHSFITSNELFSVSKILLHSHAPEIIVSSFEDQINHKVKIIRGDNGIKFNNNDMNQFCVMNGIKREFSVARTLQQNGVSKRKNRTLIEEARTMLVDSVLPTTYWAEAVSTACYVQNRVLVTKPHNKTPYELLHGADEGFFVGYSINSKTFRVFNTRIGMVKENPHITFLENKPNVAGSGPDWLFDIDLITNFMNYESVTAGNETNKNAFADDSGKKTNEKPANKGERNGQKKDEGASNKEDDQNVQDFRATLDNLLVQQKESYANSTNRDSTVSPSISTTGQSFTNADDLPTESFSIL